MSEYIDYDEICESNWVFCNEKGCNDCQYAQGDRGCKISDWIDSLPRYEISMRKIKEQSDV